MKKLILIGFKNTGKSTIGKALAKELKTSFVDLDEKIVEAYQFQTNENLTCREIMVKHGEKYFRKLEHRVLNELLEPSKKTGTFGAHQKEILGTFYILATGGGTPIDPKNQKILKKHTVIHLTSPQGVVFERIMANGTPAFFPKDQPPFEYFQKLWNERELIYKKLAISTVQNNESPEESAHKIALQFSSRTIEYPKKIQKKHRKATPPIYNL